jgi:glycosyltransferase involved in cell wall biosynthesis
VTAVRILCLTKHLSLVGGAERSQSSIIAALAARGHELCVLHEPDTFASRGAWEPHARLVQVPALHASGSHPYETSAGLSATAATARSFRPDVVYTYQHYQLPAGLLAARASRAGFVHHVRVPATGVSRRRRYRWPLSRADRVIFVSAFTFQEYVDAGFDRTRGVTVHNGVDVNEFAPLPRTDRYARRRQLGVSDTDTMLVFAGRSTPDKGLATLADVWRATRNDPGMHCVVLTDHELIGASEGRRQLAEMRGLGAVVLGWQADVASYLAASDLAIVPSRWPEPFGRSVIEPMACGVPVLASRVGGIPEILAGTHDRLLVDPGDTAGMVGRVRQLGSWRECQPGLGRAVRAHVAQRFTLDDTVRRVEGVLMSAAQSHGKAGL